MTESRFDLLSQRMARLLAESSRRSSALHGQFLHTRQTGLGDLRDLIALQIGARPAAAPVPALYDARALAEFGTGRISNCFGAAFARYDERRIPRIPNSDLLMMSRVVAIEGRPFAGSPAASPGQASIVVEYDVPPDAWYLRENASPELPTSLWMEIALQPCGFLSAYLDTYSLVPHGEFNFRNLDGFARLGEPLDVRGQTITTQARLLTSVVSGGTVIQKFAFTLTCAGRTVYSGESTFGYFSVETMANQVGLDGGQPVLPWWREQAAPLAAIDTSGYRSADARGGGLHLATGQLQFLDGLAADARGGKYGGGYVYARRAINPQDWFYRCHFYQDPVMPGSLGVEAMVEAMQGFALAQGLGAGLRAPRFELAGSDAPMSWRYRGQITPRNQAMELEVHLSGVRHQPGRVLLQGEASLWVDGLRIYEVKNITVGIQEGI